MYQPLHTVRGHAVRAIAIAMLALGATTASAGGGSHPSRSPGTGGDDGAPRQFRVDRYVLNPSAQPNPDPAAAFPYARSTVTVSTARSDVTLLGVSVVLIRENTGFFGTNGTSKITLGPVTAGRRSAVAAVDATFPENNCFAGPHPRQIVTITYSDQHRRWTEVHLAPFVWEDLFPGDLRYCHPA